MVVLKRVLTRKSILNFGYSEVRDLSVQMLLDLKNHDCLIKAYFNLEKIDFVEDILDELGITPEFRLVKPSKNNQLGKEFWKFRNSTLSNEEKLEFFRTDKAREKSRLVKTIKGNKFSENKIYLKAKNQGNFKK